MDSTQIAGCRTREPDRSFSHHISRLLTDAHNRVIGLDARGQAGHSLRNTHGAEGQRANNLTEVQTVPRIRVSDSQSTFLHIVRIAAIAAVIIGHATRPDLLFDIDITLLGRATIPTFFMIGGYFAALTFYKGQVPGASRKNKFLKSVLTRYFNMYFMFIPASLMVLAMDFWLIRAGSPFVETFKFDPDLSATRIILEFWQLLTFSGEYWAPSTVGQGVFSNAATWTMDYMMAYTVMTAAVYLLNGALRIVVLLAAAAIAGPTVMLLAPLWWFGVLAFEVHRRLEVSGIAVNPDASAPGEPPKWLRNLAIAAFLGACVAWLTLELMRVGPDLYKWSKTFAKYEYRQYLGMAKRYLWQWMYIPIIFTFLVASRYMIHARVPDGFKSAVKTASKYCFPVYAFHFTTMYFVRSLIPDYQASHTSIDPYLMLAASMMISIIGGVLCYGYVKPLTDALYNRLTEEGTKA